MSRASWYALPPGGWRDYVTLLHVPYTLWHLSYVVIGAALAPVWLPGRLGATLAAFALALGIGAHALDELRGRPLATQIPDRVLWLLAAGSIAGAVGIGIAAAIAWWPWLLAFVAFGGFIVVAYNLELFGGAFHSDLWFAVAWGAFPLLTAYATAAETITRVAARRSRVRGAAEPCPATPLDTRAPREKARPRHVRLTRARRRRDARRHSGAADTRVGRGAAHPHGSGHRARRRARLASRVST